MFVDEVSIYVESGHGGAGCVSFRRERFIPKGGPDGGDGGRGGDVVLVAQAGPTTLSELRYRRRHVAARGSDGSGAQKSGRSVPPMLLTVPVGTEVWDTDTDTLVADLTTDGEQWVAVAGGRGGLGNQHFASSTQQTPRYAQPGEEGASRNLRLELKLLADVGLVGLPNAGKSTLISRISGARPKVADYPFTTLIPNLGVVQWGDYRSFVVADIPGIIAGAHTGKGLGTQFLRHVERTRCLVYMVDVTGMAETAPGEALDTLVAEMAAHNPDLPNRSHVVVATKIDATDDDALADARAWADAHDATFFSISSASGLGLDDLVSHLGRRLENIPVPIPAAPRADSATEAAYRDIWGEDPHAPAANSTPSVPDDTRPANQSDNGSGQ